MSKHISLKVHMYVCFILLLANPLSAQAGWSNDPTVNTSVFQEYSNLNPSMTTDGVGGSIIAWSSNYLIYAQRIDANGNVVWGTDAKPISNNGDEYYPQLTGDGAGGAIIAWRSGGSSISPGIYVQRIDSNGNTMWAAGGLNISNSSDMNYPMIASDGASGAIITWQDRRSGPYYKVYAQRVDHLGNPMWQTNGLALSSATGHQYYPQIISDGSSGAIITWQDGRVGWDVYVQRIDAGGNAKWTADGVPITNDSNFLHQDPQLTSDGAGGAIMTWWQYKSGQTYRVYAQRIDNAGTVKWTAGGIPIANSSSYHQMSSHITGDGSGGAIIAWWDINNYSGVVYGVYAQRVDAGGAALWASNGVTVATPANINADYYSPQIVSDGGGGAVITWADMRNSIDRNVYAQRIAGLTGAAMWTSDGVPISTAVNDQQLPKLIQSGNGGFILTWQDMRNGNWDIYAQKVLADGTLASSCSTDPVRIADTPYQTIQNAYDNASTGDTLKLQSYYFNETVNANRGISLILKGGYLCDYLTNPEFTELYGMFTVSSGVVIIENLIVR